MIEIRERAAQQPSTVSKIIRFEKDEPDDVL
jgi:hypothetical protein